MDEMLQVPCAGPQKTALPSAEPRLTDGALDGTRVSGTETTEEIKPERAGE